MSLEFCLAEDVCQTKFIEVSTAYEVRRDGHVGGDFGLSFHSSHILDLKKTARIQSWQMKVHKVRGPY